MRQARRGLPGGFPYLVQMLGWRVVEVGKIVVHPEALSTGSFRQRAHFGSSVAPPLAIWSTPSEWPNQHNRSWDKPADPPVSTEADCRARKKWRGKP